MTVSLLLVSHDGLRWLPGVLDSLEALTRRPDRVIAIDTSTGGEAAELLSTRLGERAVRRLPDDSTFAAAVRAGLQALTDTADAAGTSGTPGSDDDWIWLLHDDSAPTPDALARLLEAAEAGGGDILGPKLREWPSLRRLLEVGVTISGTGHRETGLEPGEYDQGQHDRPRECLAVNTAGMLVRRATVEELGFDDRLPVLGPDLDFGWRAARAGYRTAVVPDAVVFHAEASRRGGRSHLAGGSPRRAERRAALYVLLANCSMLALPFQAVRLFFGSLLRAAGLLLVRAPRDAAEELMALLSVYLRPDVLARARRDRRRTAQRPAREVRPLLAAPWVPYRHGLDFVGDLAAALVRRPDGAASALPPEAAEPGPVPEEAESLPEDSGLLARLLRSPTAIVFLVLVLGALIASRGLWGSGMLSGGALLPAPGGARRWWGLYLETWHDTGLGSRLPAAPYLLPLAVAATVLLGKAWLVVDLIFFLAVPLAALTGFRFLRRVTGASAPALWGAVAYGLLLVVGGAVQEGRLGTVVGVVVLPLVAHAAWFLAPGCSLDRRRRASWRTALLLALLSAFVPIAWAYAAVLWLIASVGLVVATRSLSTVRQLVLLPLIPVLVVPVLLLPWSLLVWQPLGWSAWLAEAGLPVPGITGPLSVWDVVLGRPGDLGGAPGWISAGIVVAALVALLRVETRPRVLVAWAAGAVAWVLAAVVSTLSGGAYLGFLLLLAQAMCICAVALAGTGVRHELTGTSFGWRQPLGVMAVLAAMLTPLAGALWWMGTGDSGPLDRRPATTVPPYMTDAMATTGQGVLLIRGSERRGFGYVVLRGPGVRLGEDSVTLPASDRTASTAVVADLVSVPTDADVRMLADLGIGFVYAPAPADGRLVGNLDSVSGLTSASALHRGARAWQVEEPGPPPTPPSSSGVRPWLLALEALALLVAGILSAPSRRRSR